MPEKIRKHPILIEIENNLQNYLKILTPYEDKINKDSNFKYIIAYSNLLISYGEEVWFID
ncbi:hypothetical protein [Clostridium pasteurianum]|uniref:Uncharacterized protein n=1 Tax=Clostridium pasteurianum BC1 TaxID=86416 RepID=R4K484_CLOPA|nr:hypothetical protein [Clostridium pasteurianum]AGK96496.1 hypothetical protein Clopa_1561 [Clostridium pasteurianum BC1]